jgi:GntR family transcriptional regulator
MRSSPELPLLITGEEHVPIYMQVVHQVRYLITSRHLKVGDQLPSVRDIANQLGINTGTAALAYRTLQQDRLIESRRGKGTYVANLSDDNHSLAARMDLMRAAVDALVQRAYALGFDAGEVRQTIASRFLAQPRVLPVVLAMPVRWAAEKYAPMIAAALPHAVVPDVRPVALSDLVKAGPVREGLYRDAYFTVTFQSAVPALDTALREAGIASEIVGITAHLTDETIDKLHLLDAGGDHVLFTESRNVSSALTVIGQNSPLDVRRMPILTERSSTEEIDQHQGSTVLYTLGVLDLLDQHRVPHEDRLELAFTLSDESRATLRSLLDATTAYFAAP